MSKPTIVIVPASFTPPTIYGPLTDSFVSQGFETRTVALVSAGRRDPLPPGTLQDDADAIAAAVTELADAAKDVVLVSHSYGGIPATMAAKGLLKTDRQASGKSGGIIHITYISSVILRVGQSLRALMGAGPSPNIEVNGDYLRMVDLETYAKGIYSDLPLEKAMPWVKQTCEQSVASLAGELTYAAYVDVPVSYISCTRDVVVAPAFQDVFIQSIRDQGGKVQVFKIDAGHAPVLSVPEKVVQAVEEAIAAL